LQGIDGLTVHEAARPHPEQADVVTLGECITESYPSLWEGPDTVRSSIALYYGSFLALAKRDADFDWDVELWETITHELQHHLESLAREDDLEGVDYVMEEDTRRGKGEPFDPFYYQQGVERAAGVFVAEDLVFVERRFGQTPPAQVSFDLSGRSWTVDVPPAEADLHYLRVEAFVSVDGRPSAEMTEREGRTEVVLLHDPKLAQRLRRLGTPLRLAESGVRARAQG